MGNGTEGLVAVPGDLLVCGRLKVDGIVTYLVMSPLDPSEQAIVDVLPDALSYAVSYETLRVVAVAIAAAVRPVKMLKNFIFAESRLMVL